MPEAIATIVVLVFACLCLGCAYYRLVRAIGDTARREEP